MSIGRWTEDARAVVAFQGELWSALAQVGQLLAAAEKAFLAGDFKTTDRLLIEAADGLGVVHALQRRAEDDLLESPLVAAPDTRSIVDAAVRVVTASGPFAFVNVTLSAGGAGEGLATEEGVEPLDVRRAVG